MKGFCFASKYFHQKSFKKIHNIKIYSLLEKDMFANFNLAIHLFK